ncbi:MAG: efflux RND transporter periplasmic adaptor subunit [Sulfurimonas sp.]|nr:efflux RND transporter periplasmic adaptor subunit [Sulfurimonas sp.]
MRFLLIISILLTLSFAKQVTVEQLFSVQTIKVKKIDIAKKIKSYGFVAIDESRVYDVTPRFGGYVEKLYVNATYDIVKKGDKLVKVYSPKVLKAKDDYLNTIKYTKSRPNKIMLKSSKEKLSLLNILPSEISSISNNRKTSPFTTIVSPADGYIFKKSINNNSAFNEKKLLFRIVNLDKVWVEVRIRQDQLNDLKNIKKFIVTTATYTKKFQAKKIQLYPELNQKEESFTLRLEIKNFKHLLKPGMYATIKMHSAVQSYLTLPTTAVIRKNSKFYVFVVGEYEGEYEPLEVNIEVLNPNTYIIKSGLKNGDEVVNNALFMMDSDAQINGLY